MYLIIIFFILCSGAAMFSLIFNKRIEETLAMWILVMIIILYIAGLLGKLKMGIHIIMLLGIVSVIVSCYNLYLDREKFIKNVWTPGFVVFIIFFVIAWWAQRGRMLTSWDEFSHWGTVVKNMYIFDALGNHPGSTVTFRGYPPATALLEYFWVKLSGSFSEGNLNRAMNILYFSLMLPIFSNINWKSFSKIVIRFTFILILPLAFFQDFYSNLMVDAILGVMLSNVLFTYYVNELSTFKLINISLTLFVLTITKSSGFGLAIIAIMIMTIDLLVKQRKSFRVVLFPIFFTLLSKYSWSIYLKVTKTGEAWETSGVNVQNIKDLFTGNAPHYRMITIKNFCNAFTETFLTDHTFKLSFMGWIVILLTISIMLITFICNEEEKGRYRLGLSSIFIGSVIYATSLLILYVFTYTEYEATNLASYSRYTGTYILGALIFLVVTTCLKEENKLSCSTVLLVFLLITIKVTPVINNIILAPGSVKNTIAKRTQYETIRKIKGLVNPKKDKVYIISAGSHGYDYWVCRYNITPIKTNLKLDSWSLGKSYYEGDIWTKDISAMDWAKELKIDYTYVYIYKTNDGFNKTYGEIFEGGEESVKIDTLYYVNKSKEKIVLEKIR